jgi:hypothetical protein
MLPRFKCYYWVDYLGQQTGPPGSEFTIKEWFLPIFRWFLKESQPILDSSDIASFFFGGMTKERLHW